MEIGTITITQEELHEAVTDWLWAKKLRLNVVDIQKYYGLTSTRWEVTCTAVEPASEVEPPLALEASGHKGYFCAEGVCLEKVDKANGFCPIHQATKIPKPTKPTSTDEAV